MADAKISQLPAATTPLAGTELVPIVQSSTTKRATVANVLAAGLPVAASTLSATGNVTLGDATSDTISATGRFNTDLVPSTDNARDLGTSALKWKQIFATTLTEGTSPVVVQTDISADPNEIPLNQYLGTMAFQDAVAINIGRMRLSGDITSAAWTTNGIRIQGQPATFTDTTSSGTVAAAYTNVFGGNTIAASSATTYTTYATHRIAGPTAGTNVTFTNALSLSLGGHLGIDNDANVILGTGAGTKIGTAVTQKIGFWNVTPVVQPASANQAEVATTAATDSTPWGFSTQAQADSIVTLLNEIRSALVAVGIIKGAA